MKSYKIRKQIRPKLTIGAVMVSLAMFSCRSDFDSDAREFYAESGDVRFKGFVQERPEAITRTLTQEPLPVTFIDYPMDFYIEMTYTDSDGQPQSEIGTYQVPPGTQAYLRDKEDEVPALNWNDPTTMHTFWSWTVPWEYQEPPTVDPDDSGDPDPDPDPDPLPDVTPYTPSLDPIKVTIEDSRLGDMEADNMKVLETFVGTKTDPTSYQNTGNGDVALQYKHLVSKIIINRFTFIDVYNVAHNDMQGNVMFVNMPTEFTFYPHPENGGAPIAITNFDSADEDGGPTFAITNPKEGEPRDEFYICPEIDFSKVEFRVTMSDKASSARGDYWGTFEMVEFDRSNPIYGEDGDDFDDYNDPAGGDEKILHAGEVMILNMQVKEYGGSGISCQIADWGGPLMQDAKYRPHPGVYSDAEAKELIDAFGKTFNQTTANNMFSTYGDGYTGEGDDVPDYFKNLGIYHLYGDVTAAAMTFPIWDGYILDGMGYTINMTPKTPADPNDPIDYTVTIGKMRDVYIKAGDYTIYIDSQGTVFIENSQGVYIETSLKVDKVSNSIDLKALYDQMGK